MFQNKEVLDKMEIAERREEMAELETKYGYRWGFYVSMFTNWKQTDIDWYTFLVREVKRLQKELQKWIV